MARPWSQPEQHRGVGSKAMEAAPACGMDGGMKKQERAGAHCEMHGYRSREEPQRMPMLVTAFTSPKKVNIFKYCISSLSWRGKIGSENKGISHYKLSSNLGS